MVTFKPREKEFNIQKVLSGERIPYTNPNSNTHMSPFGSGKSIPTLR
jgi:hypothetical protein